MNIMESFRIAINAIRVNKMRSILTMLGIIIGISSVIAVLTIGSGGQAAINGQFESFGVNRLMIYLNTDQEYTMRDFMTLDDVDALNEALGDKVQGISPSYSQSMQVVQKLQSKDSDGISVNALGVNESYNNIVDIDLLKGRFIKHTDSVGSRFVTIIDEKLAKDIFGTTDVLGKKITLSAYNQKLNFTIVGIQKAEEDSLLTGYNQISTIYVPYNTMARILGMGDTLSSLQVNAAMDTDKDEIEKTIKSVLSKRHRNEESMYDVYSAESEIEIINSVTGVITGIISAIAAISLLVGGIGVMNIMLVSVTERTREIGIRKALGARRKDILMQFLVEAIIISLLGGVIGTILGAGIASIAAWRLEFPMVVPISAVVIAWVFSAGVGIFFGLYPANQAAKLDPIDALRYE